MIASRDAPRTGRAPATALRFLRAIEVFVLQTPRPRLDFPLPSMGGYLER